MSEEASRIEGEELPEGEDIILPDADTEPKSGEWVDSEEFFGDLIDEERRKGEELGQTIDTDDDEDAGL